MTFAEFIKEKRQKSGKAQQDAARDLGISPSALSLWEKGGSTPRPDLHLKVARYYRMTQKEVGLYLDPNLVLDSDELAETNERTIRLVHATTDCQDSTVINDAVKSVIQEMAGAGWRILFAQTALAVYDQGLSKRNSQWCATLVFER